MPLANIATSIGKWVLKVFWPWFLKHIWPLISVYLLKIVESVLQTLSETFGSFLDGRMQSREEQARERAAAADEAAKTAETEGERSEAEAIAGVWREVAEQFRQENEALRGELDRSMSNALALARTRIEDSEPVLAQDGEQLVLEIGDQTSVLPALPVAPSEPDA